MEPDEALSVFARELVSDAVALAMSGNVPVTVPPPAPGMQSPPPPARTGAGAVHPHLGGHLVTAIKHDTISGHAYKHVPKPLPVQQPDAKTVKLQETQEQLAKHQEALARVQEYRQAAAELDKHSGDLAAKGITLPGTWKPWTPDEHESHARFAEDAVAGALRGGKATSHTETYDGRGQVWKPDRAAVHRDIVQEHMQRAEKIPSGHRAVLVGGIPGRARDSVAKQAAPEKDYLHVSTDAIKEDLARRGLVPEVSGLSPAEASPLVHHEAEHIADLVTREALRRGKNIAVHTAMADHETVKAHVARFREAGHTVHGVFVHTPVDKAVESARAAHRAGHDSWRNQDGIGGKHVPSGLLHAADAGDGHTANFLGFEASKPHLGSWEHWDAAGTPARTKTSGQQAAGGIPSPEELHSVFR